MSRWTQRLRGLLGLGAIGGLTGALLGSMWGVAARLLGLDPAPLLEQVVNFGLLGLISGSWCAAGFGALLATLDGRKSLDQLPLWRMALFGAAVGAALPLLFIFGTSGLVNFTALPGVVAGIVGTGALLGGGLATGLVGAAKRAHRREMGLVRMTALPGSGGGPGGGRGGGTNGGSSGGTNGGTSGGTNGHSNGAGH